MSLKGYKQTEEHKRKRADAIRGFRHSEQTKKKISAASWKGGRFKDNKGYIRVYMPEHDNSYGNYMLEHRVVLEKILKRKLETFEAVHHLNGIKDDNRPENLVIVNTNNHFGTVRCPHCLGSFLIK